MREIRFRGKRVDNGEWAYWNEFGETTEPFLCKTGAYGYIAKLDIIPETVGQYTGLHESKGTDIYEGDFVTALKHNEFPHTNVISWRVGMFWFGNWNWYEFLNIFRSIEIVGNIYENPEIPSGGTSNE